MPTPPRDVRVSSTTMESSLYLQLMNDPMPLFPINGVGYGKFEIVHVVPESALSSINSPVPDRDELIQMDDPILIGVAPVETEGLMSPSNVIVCHFARSFISMLADGVFVSRNREYAQVER